MRHLKFFAAFALLCLFVSAIGPANAGVSNPPNIPLPSNPAGWCSATALQPGTVRTTQIGDCPDTRPRQLRADVCYSYGPSNCVNNVDVTRFETIWGRTGPSDTSLVMFPGENVFAIIKNMQKGGYVALAFRAPAGPLTAHGTLNHAATTSGPPIDATISNAPGQFDVADSRCERLGVGTGANILSWKLPGYTGPALCPLTPNAVYYLNIRISDPAAVHFDCAGSSCRVNIQNNHTP